MLDIKIIRENPDLVKKAITDRQLKLDIGEALTLDVERRKLLIEVEGLKNKKNTASNEIAKLMKEKKNAKEPIEQMKVVSQKIDEIDTKVEEIDQKLANLMLIIPNIPHNSVPVGPDSAFNKVVKTWGETKELSFPALTHAELCEKLDIVDFPRATKITGSNFPLYKGLGARLERALINFMLDLHTKKHGYTEISPPFMVNRASMTGTGQLPKLELDMYRLKDDDFFLIPTAEVPVTNIHRDEMLKEEDLPIYYTAYTPCFRREAGSYGKTTKGLSRVHQFDKVELVKFTLPEKSYEEHEKLLADAEEVLQLLGLPYRIALLSTGDLSFAASKCYDIEAWAAASKMWFEVSSCSNFEDFQARRANIRYRSKEVNKKVNFVHTLNGSGVAMARTVIAILENYQQPDGTVIIPEVLRPYMDGMDAIK